MTNKLTVCFITLHVESVIYRALEGTTRYTTKPISRVGKGEKRECAGLSGRNVAERESGVLSACVWGLT